MLSDVGTSKSVNALRSCPGYKLFSTTAGGPIRGSISSATGRAFVVSANKFIEINSDGTNVEHGTLNTQVGRISAAENITQIIVVDGKDGWVFTKATNTWAQVTDADFPVCSFIIYQDGYFLAVEDGTQKFYIPAINDGTSWGALDFTSVESSPDALVGIISHDGNIWIFGNRTVEVYQNTGAVDFPFERIPGAIIQTGCAGGHTVAKCDNSVVWLGTDEQGQGIVWQSAGYSAKRISTQAIEAQIAKADNYREAYAWVYHEQGHIFYSLHVPGLEATLVYDATTQLWHERAFYDQNTASLVPHRASCHLFFNQKNLIGDRLSGNIYEISLDYFSDDGEELVRERTSPHLDGEKSLISFTSFELDLEVGRGLQTGQGKDPQIMMQYSDDGGRTWSSEIWLPLGKVGEYYTRVAWRRLGASRDRVFRVRVTDPIFVQINEAYVNSGN